MLDILGVLGAIIFGMHIFSKALVDVAQLAFIV